MLACRPEQYRLRWVIQHGRATADLFHADLHNLHLFPGSRALALLGPRDLAEYASFNWGPFLELVMAEGIPALDPASLPASLASRTVLRTLMLDFPRPAVLANRPWLGAWILDYLYSELLVRAGLLGSTQAYAAVGNDAYRQLHAHTRALAPVPSPADETEDWTEGLGDGKIGNIYESYAFLLAARDHIPALAELAAAVWAVDPHRTRHQPVS